MVDCAGHLVDSRGIHGSNQVVIHVIQPHVCLQRCMPNSVELLLEVHEDMVKALLVLQVFVGLFEHNHSKLLKEIAIIKSLCQDLKE